MAEALVKAVAIFDREELPSPAELGAVFQALGKPQPDEALNGMIAAVRADRAAARPPLPADTRQAVIKDGIVRSPVVPHGSPLVSDLDGAKTLYEIFHRSFVKFADRPCLGTREVKADGSSGAYVFESYGKIWSRASLLGAGLVQLAGIVQCSKLGINMRTRAEWTLCMLASYTQAICDVTLYDSFGLAALEFVINQAELSAVVTEDAAKFIGLAAKCPSLKTVITLVVNDDLKSKAQQANVKLLTLAELEAHGMAYPLAPSPPSPSDLAVICYTSGTTGNPKGVTHSHATIVAGLSGLQATGLVQSLMPNDVHFAMMPLAHIGEYIVECTMLTRGLSFGFWNGVRETAMEDLATLKPTFLWSVPRILSRIYDKMQAGFSRLEGVQKMLFDLAWKSKEKGLALGRLKSFWDFIIFAPAAAGLGGRIRVIASGAAPIAAEKLTFFRIVLSAHVAEAYGMTEVTVTHLSDLWDFAPGRLGPPAAQIEIKLQDIPELGYTSADKPDPRGEILFRGPCCMLGYYNNAETTKATIDADGWVHSGDVGVMHSNGTLSIIDRAKNLFKLPIGEYVAPERLEAIYARCPLVAQIYVHGEPLKADLVAIVVPDPEGCAVAAKQAGLEGNVPALMKSGQLKALVLQGLQKEAKLAYEVPKAICLWPSPFTPENDLVTPTLKLKRFVAKKFFATQIEELYAALPPASPVP